MESGVALILDRQRLDGLEGEPRQNPDFLYLTGVDAPNAAAIFSTTKPHFTLFMESPGPEREQWTGPMLKLAEAKRQFRADAVYPIEELEKRCVESFGKHDRVFYTLGSSDRGDALVKKTLAKLKHSVRDGVRAPAAIHDLSRVTAEMRLYKTQDEIECIRKAVSITAAALRNTADSIRPGRYEYEAVADIEATFRRAGVVRSAYQSIVCSGPKTCILHCPTYDRKLEKGDLLLLDVGAEWDGYAADITRTVPVSGTFSRPQRLIYDIVLAAQKMVIGKIKPGVPFDELERTARGVLIDGLLRGHVLMDTPRNDDEKIQRSHAYFPHKIGHWLGMDVHDVGSYHNANGKGWRILEPGMVLTVEPGLYFPKGTKGVRKEFWDIGVRIEDDVLVTKTGHEVLSRRIPKQ